MEPLTQNLSTPTHPPHTHNQGSGPALLQPRAISDTSSTTFGLQNGTRKRRRQRPGLNSEFLMTTTVNNSSSSTHNLTADATGNTKLSSPSPSAPASKIRSTTTTTTTSAPATTSTPAQCQELPIHQNSFHPIDEHAVDSKRYQSETVDPFPSGNSKTVEIENSISNSNEKFPKSSFRRTSSSRSALSLVFDISQNETISRSNSVSSRSESRQGKYHTECYPEEDPNLKIENRGRIRSARGYRNRTTITNRPGSEVSLLGRRESVTNLIFSGPSTVDGEEGGRDTVYLKKLQFQNSSRSSLLFGRMASSLKGYDVTPGEFDVMVDEDYSVSRLSKVATPTSTDGTSPHRSRASFLYQVMDFDKLSKDVPPFVKTYAQKNGKMITESFILRLNYLRRRRQLGEVSSTINISSSSGHSHSHGNIHATTTKRSSPTAS